MSVSGRSTPLDERFVLDAHALLTYLNDEPGAHEVEAIFAAAAMGEAELWRSAVNLGEVAYTIQRRAGPDEAAKVLGILAATSLRVVAAHRDDALRAAALKATFALGYADAFAVALARDLGATVVTGDPDFAAVSSVIDIRWVNRSGAR